MKKLLLILGLVLVLGLSACSKEYEYSDFEKAKVTSHLQAETKNEDIYFLYYYSETCVYCNEVKQDILTFFKGNEDMTYFMLNVDNASDDSSFDEYRGTPTVLVISNGEVVDVFESRDGVEDFIFEYSDFDASDLGDLLTYSMFDHIDSFDDVENQAEGSYFVYFYHKDCGYCKQIKSTVLEYAYGEPDGLKVYMLNGEELPSYANTYGITGTPSIIYVENNEFVSVGKGTTGVLGLLNVQVDDYNDFDHLDDFDDVETQPEGTYLVYYYSRSCGYCNQIKEEVLEFARENSSELKVYFIDAQQTASGGAYEITGTPTMLYIVDNDFSQKIVGAFDIPEFIQGLNE